MAQIYIKLRNPRQICSQILKHIFVIRNYHNQHYNRNNNSHDAYRYGVDHCFLHHCLGLVGTLQLGRHTFQCYFQTTGCLTRSHHIHHDPWEYLRVFCHGVCQGLTFFHADADFLQCFL